MRVVFYSHPAFFEPALCLIRELSTRAEVHLLLEVSPSAWRTATFDVGERRLSPGIVSAEEILRDAFPPGVADYWRAAASFHLVVHPTARSLHPASYGISREALRFAIDRGADVLHVDDVDVSPRMALALPGFRQLPLTLSVHDPEPHSGERNWRKTLARALAYRRATNFILYNRSLAPAFAERYRIAPSRINVARLGVYDVFAQWPGPQPAGGSRTVLFFGRISRYKGLDLFYAAARLIAARVSGVRFVVAGRPVEGYALPPAPTLASGSTIEIIDRYLSNEDAAALFRGAAMVVCPYRDASQSGVVLTAFAFGVPVVATDVGGLSEYVRRGRTGMLVPPDSTQELAAAIESVLANPEFARQLSRNVGAAAANEFHWRHTVEALLLAYERAVLAHHGDRHSM